MTVDVDELLNAINELERLTELPAILHDCRVVIEALRDDARRYRWLRQQHWNESTMCVVEEPKSALLLGSRCPSGALLDDAIDAKLEK